MAFEGVKIHSTRNGGTPVDGYRDDLVIADAMLLSLTSSVGVSSYKWEILGRPEGSVAGGAGPEPIQLGNASTAAYSVDNDVGQRRDGTYTIQCTVNDGTPTRTAIRALHARGTGLTVSGGRKLRKIGAFEALDDTSAAGVAPSWATQMNRWLEQVQTGTGGGGSGGAGTVSLIAGDSFTVNTAEAVVGEVPVNFDDFSGTNAQFRLSAVASRTAGTGTVRLLLGGTSMTPDGTQVAAASVTSGGLASYTNLGAAGAKPSGVQLVKVSLVPPVGQSITCSSAGCTIIVTP